MYERVECISYGLGNEFVESKFKKISNRHMFNKPNGGLWSSPVICEYGWRDWSNDNDWGDLSTNFKFIFHGKVLIIDSLKDLSGLPVQNLECHQRRSQRNHGAEFPRNLDFVKINKSYDAIWLTAKGEREARFERGIDIYGWDCETLLVMNQNVIRLLS